MVRVSIDEVGSHCYAQIKEHAAQSGCSVLLLVAPDTDALAACRILTTLMDADNVIYKLKAVAGYLDVREATKTTVVDNEELRSIVMLNCGNLVHTDESLAVDDQPLDLNDESAPFVYMFDCHKPIYHTNLLHDKVYVLDDGFVPPQEEVPSENDSDYEFDMEEDNDEEEEEDDEQENDSESFSESEVDEQRDTDDQSENAETEQALERRRKRLRKRSKKRRQDQDGKKKKRRGVDEKRLEKKKRWKSYYDGDYYGLPIAYIMYRLAQQLNKDRNDLLWLAIVGTTDHYIHHRMDEEAYKDVYNDLRQEVVVHNDRPAPPGSQGDAARRENGEFDSEHPLYGGTSHGGAPVFDENGNWVRSSNGGGNSADGGSIRAPGDEPISLGVVPAGRLGYITPVMEYKFFLHRHWTLYNSLYYSPTVGTQLELWTSEDGKDKLHKLLAHCGVPLRDAKQPWQHMQDTTKKKVARIPRWCREAPEDLQEFRMELLYSSFTRQVDYGTPVSAADVAYATTALLENAVENNSGETGTSEAIETGDEASGLAKSQGGSVWRHNWLAAYEALSSKRVDLLRRGIKLAMRIQQSIARVGPTIVRASHYITSSGPVRTVTLPDLTDQDRIIFTQPLALAKLGNFIIDYHQICREEWLGHPSRGKRLREKDKAKPLIMFAHNPVTSFYTVVGITVTENSQQVKTKLADVLRDAGRQSGCHFMMDGFDQSTLWIHEDYYDRFREFLTEHMFNSTTA